MRQVPEPGHGEWVARMRERARLDAEELLPRPAFAVLGLAAPPLRPMVLAAAGQVDGDWETITLAYGDWAAAAGPFVALTSAVLGPDAPGLGAEAELRRAIDRERDRLADHAGVNEDEPPGPPECRPGGLRAPEGKLTGLICWHGGVWAARVQADGVTVTVAARGVPPGSVRLGPVTDLGPYLQGRGEMLGRLSEHHRQRPPPVLAPAEGVAAYRALADEALGSQARLAAALRDGRLPRHRAGEGATWHALWQRAAREQARISGIGLRQADDIVTLVVNHLTHLQEKAPWFSTEPRLREAAIDETLRHAVLGEDVPSRPAQHAWARYWADQRSLGAHEPGAAPGAALAAGEPLISAWLAAWSAWTRGPGGGVTPHPGRP